MLTACKRIGGPLLGLALGFSWALPALADDTEIYVTSNTPPPDVRPNILFVVDTSGSMTTKDAENERTPYNEGTTYATSGNCTGGRIFFRRPGEPQPNCSSTNYIVSDSDYNKCRALRRAAADVSGRWIGKTAQYDVATKSWRDLQASGVLQSIECLADSGIHGPNSDSDQKWAQNGDSSNRWSNNPARVIDWNASTTYTFYSANWLNWYRVTPATSTLSRMSAVKQAAIGMASSVDGVNLGLMRYSNNGGDGEQVASGGYVVQAVGDVDANRKAIIDAIDAFGAAGNTPLSETLYEAYLYYTGGTVKFGGFSKPALSSAATGATSGDSYISPIIGECQKNYVIYLTDGLPTTDNEADDEIEGLTKKSCTVDASLGQKTGSDGICMDDLAGYMSTADLKTSVSQTQSAITYTIGFGAEVKDSQFLPKVAAAGKGQHYFADNSEKLAEVLNEITQNVLSTSTTFTTASVGVNAFNRAQTREDLYFALFAPDEQARVRWDGNLKKYKLAVIDTDADPEKEKLQLIVTGQGTATDAIDQVKGVFKDTSRSFWSDEVDGNIVTSGGAANELPATRTLYTYLGANPAGSSGSLVALNTATAADFGATTTADERTATLAFAYANTRMGDPLHSQPSVVTYNTTTDVVYMATNDGYLHAIDASNGKEKWAFVPKELLPRLKTLLANPGVTSRSYGLDGDVTVLRLDKNGNGIIEATDDRVWLYVGMRRGGNSYYALDVTNPDSPSLMWFDGIAELPGVGETWSPPVITRVDVKDAAQNNQKLALIFGGGYDAAQENVQQVDDNTGNRIFMVDAKTGGLLWYGTVTGDAAGTDAQKALRSEFADMKNSIPGRITVIDTDGDQFADRMYAGDMGGRVWRFDIFKGKSGKDFVTGGVFAELGEGRAVTPLTTDMAKTRRFYNAPDVALIQRRGADPYYNIAIGSGYRGHPLNTQTVDRFYALRDKTPFMKFTQSQYDSRTRLNDDSLVNITSGSSAVDATSAGWKYVFSARVGEKVLSESTTAADVILVSTYQPDTSGGGCRPASKNRVYAFKADNGAPALDLNRDGKIDGGDTYTDVVHEGILGNVNVGLLRGKLADDLKPKTPGPPTVCLAGMHILGQCVQVDDSVRTYWRRDYDPSN